MDAENHGEMFFWHVRQKHLADRQRTIIWLNGGPGCSSMDGLFLEIGPFRFQDDKTLVENDGSWHEFANILFLDQPLGTGFSFVDGDHYIHELDQMAEHVMQFLDRFLELFPEYARDDVRTPRRYGRARIDDVVLYSRRIVCWTIHTICCKGDAGGVW